MIQTYQILLNKIFPVNQINDIIIDNESETKYFINDKENIDINLNINESKNKEITLDKSKQNINNIEDNLSEFSSILNSINLIYYNKNNFNNNIIIPQIENIKPKEESKNNFLCETRNIFYINDPLNFKNF